MSTAYRPTLGAPDEPRFPVKLVLRFLLLVAILAAGFAILRWTPLAGYMNGPAITVLFDRLRGTWWAPALLVASYVVLCPIGIPATPMMIAGGVVFGAALGAVYNVLGTFLAAVVSYYLARALGRDFVVHFAGQRLKRVERRIARRGFWSLVGVRFLPLPFALVNYCAALAGVRPALYIATSALGLALPVTLYTYFAAALSQAAGGERAQVFLQLAVALVLLAAVIFVPRFWLALRRRRRYRDLRQVRRDRPVRPQTNG